MYEDRSIEGIILWFCGHSRFYLGDWLRAAAEERASYNVELTEAGAQKIAVIKVVREITGLALGDAKAMVDGAPKVVKEGVPTAEAEAMKK